MELSTFYEKCQTGDILLFSSNRWYSKLIELFTHSPYSHVGIILRDPTFLDPSLKGLFLFESGYEPMKSPEDGKVKYGVQISKLEDVIARCRTEKSGNLYYRAVHCDRDAAFEANLSAAHAETYDKPYDFNVCDWIKAEFDVHIGNEQRTAYFWCSALVAFTFYKLGLLPNIDWTIIKPCAFGCRDKSLQFLNCSLDPEVQIHWD